MKGENMKQIIFSVMILLTLFHVSGCTREPVEYTDWTIIEKSYTPSVPAESGRWAYVLGRGFTYVFGTSEKTEEFKLKIKRESEKGNEQIITVLVSENAYNAYSIGDVYKEENQNDNHQN